MNRAVKGRRADRSDRDAPPPSRVPRWALVCVAALCAAGAGACASEKPDAAPLPPPLSPHQAPTPADAAPLLPAWSADDIARRFPGPDRDAAAADFSGTARCVECHEERKESLLTSFHASLTKDPRGCEACHGPGDSHSETEGIDPIRHPWDAPAKVMIGACVQCHTDVLAGPVRDHRAWITPKPLPGGDPATEPALRACSACHEIHIDKTAPAHAKDVGPFRDIAALAKVAEAIPASRCIACHTDYHPQMARSGHSELLSEGAECGSCHGNGSLHEASGGRARLIINPARQSPSDADKTCESCHRSGAVVQRWTC